jgi:diguanylate cyclase (GGDEF)-like protein
MLELGQREFTRSLRYSRPLAALMIDIDHFKRINDSYGHPAGDQVLRVLGERCREYLRREDILSRIGGEEFLALLPDTDLQSALRVAKRLRRLVTQEAVLTSQGEVRLAISIGVAARTDSIKSLMDLVSRADDSLYAAKQAGRDQVKA